MTHEELLRHILRGRLLLVGEFRGARAEAAGYVDQRTGQAISYVRAVYIVECTCRGVLDLAIIRQKRLSVEDPEQVQFPYEKGKHYVFFLEGFKVERGIFSGWIGDRGPEAIETEGEAVGAPAGASAPVTLSLCKQFHSPYDKEQSRFPLCLSNVGKRQSSFHVDIHIQRFVERQGHKEEMELPADASASRLADAERPSCFRIA
jgi:hypothetical protein